MKKFLLTLFAALTATFAMGQTNLLTNASFEEWADGYPTDWKSTTSASTSATILQSTDAHEGTYAVEIKSVASSNKRLASKEIELEAGTYTFSIWMKSAGEASVAKMGYAYMDGSSIKYVYCKDTEGKEIEYNLTSEYVECSGTFTLETATTVNIVVMNNKKSNAISIIADDASLIVSEGGGEDPDPTVDISNTAETAYTVTEAIALIDAGKGLSTKVYVKGEISVVTEINLANGNATYDITDGDKTLTVYRGKYLQEKNFFNADQIQDGDEVIVFGKLTLYTNQTEGTTTYEMAQGNYLYSLNGQTEAEIEPTPDPSSAITVAQAHELAANATALIEGATVYALCKNGAVFGDATGYIYYYNTATSGLAVGDIVTISGAVSKYNGFNQFTSTATITKTGTAPAIEYPDAADIDLDAWVASPTIQFVKLTGTLNISNNKYYNIVVEGKTAQGSIVGPVADMFSGIESGNTITVEGFAMYPSGSSTKYANIVATKVSKDEEGGGGEDPDPTVDISNTPETAYTVSRAIEIIKEGKGLSTQVYVKGEVTEVTEVSVENGNATYTIADETGAALTIFRGKYLQQKNFTNADQIQDGDEVIVYGKLILYQKDGQEDQYQMDKGNYLYSKNGQTEAEEIPVSTVTVSEAQAAAAGTTVTVVGSVYALCNTGAVLGDETGFIYYYNTNIAEMKWNIGDQGSVTGALAKYQGFNQFTADAEVEYIGHADITYPEPAELDLDAWAATPVIQYVTLTGAINISGNYYNIIVEGKTAQGSIIGAQADMFSNITNGSTITVEGFAMYTTSKGKYVNIVATKVTVDEVVEKQDITNTAETPWTVTDALNFIANEDTYDLSKQVYVTGIISEIVSLDATKYKRAQYNISDDGTTENQLLIYNGYFLEGHNFVANDQIAVNDKVIVYGQLVNYNGTAEMAQNNYIYSLNGETTDGIRSIDNGQLTMDNVLYDLSGRRVEKATKGIYIVNGKKIVK